MEHSRPADTSLIDERTRRLFPLRLTPFEAYMFLDRREDNWILFLIQIQVEGTVDRTAFTEAVAFAGSRHPLSVATVVRGAWGRYFWTLDANQLSAIFWTDGGHIPETWHHPPDLTREAGVRVLVEQRVGEATITLQFHHSVCDGVASGQWLEDMLLWYASLTGPPEMSPQPVELEPERLLDRNRHRWPVHSFLERMRRSIIQLAEFYWHLPRTLRKPAAPPPPEEQDFAGLVSHHFTWEQSQALRQAAQQQGVSLNDWLMRDLFKAIASWNLAADDNAWFSNPWYRINMPMSMRERADVATPATNLVGLTFLNRRRSEIEGDSGQLLAGIARESDRIRRQRKGTIFLETLARVDAVPGFLKLLLRMPLCLTTAILTNLGDPCRRFAARFPKQDGYLLVGNLIVRNFGGAPTLRRNTHVAVAVNTYRDRITLNLQMTPGTFGRRDVERFLRLFVQQTEAAVAEANAGIVAQS